MFEENNKYGENIVRLNNDGDFLKSNVFIVIAAFNEEKVIGRVLNGLKKAGYENVVVVDDGSKDKTFEICFKKGVFALQHKKNKGQGAALRTGINFAVKNKADVVVTFDADGQHKVSEIKKIVKPVLDEEFDVALGSRFLNKKTKLSFMIRFLLYCGIFLQRILYGVKLTDVHNGFRAFSRKAAKKIKIKCDRMEHASEIIEQVKIKKLSYVEVPVTIKYTKYSVEHGQSPWDRVMVGLRLVKHRFFK